jgi:glycosidase
MINIMRHWLDIGVDGFRVDAVPYLCKFLPLFYFVFQIKKMKLILILIFFS